MSLQGQHWIQRLGTMAETNPSLAHAAPGLAIDQATVPYEAMDPEQLRALQELSDYYKATTSGDDQRGAIGDILNFGGGVLEALIWPYKQLSTNVLSPVAHLPLVAFSDYYQEKYAEQGFWDRMYGLWHESDLWAEHDSFGRAVATNIGILGDITSISHDETGFHYKGGQWFDGFSTEEIRELQHRRGFGSTSGAIDFVSNFFLDPLIVGGKIAKSARALRTTVRVADRILSAPEEGARLTEAQRAFRLQARRQSVDELVASGPVQNFLSDIDGWTAHQIARHPAIRESPQAGQIADLLAQTDRQGRELIWRIGIGDETAMSRLEQTAPRVAADYRRLRGAHDRLYSQIIANPRAEAATVQRWRARLEELDARVAAFERENQTTLALARTEFMPFTGQYSQDALISQSFATMYRGAPSDPTALLAPEGLVPRNGRFLLASLDEHRAFDQSFRRYLDMQENRAALSDPRRSRRAAAVPDVEGYTAPVLPMVRGAERAPTPDAARLRERQARVDAAATSRASGVGPRFSGTQWQPMTLDEVHGTRSLREWVERTAPGRLPARRTLPEAEEAARPAGARQRPITGLPPLREIRGMVPARPVDEALAEAAERQPGITGVADEVQGQLNLLDDLVAPELRDLEAEVGWWPQVMDEMDTLARVRHSGGIYGSLELAPRGGAYRYRANRAARRATRGEERYMRGERLFYDTDWSTRAARGVLGMIRRGEQIEDRFNRGARPLNRRSFFDRPRVMLNTVPRYGRDLATGQMTPRSLTLADPESWKGLNTYLKRVRRFDPATRLALVREHMTLTSPGQKMEHLERVESVVIAHMLNDLGDVSPDAVKAMVEVTMGYRRGLVDRMNSGIDNVTERTANAPRGSESAVFSTAYDAGRRVDLVGDDGEALVASPLFRAQLMSEFTMLPLDEVQRAMWQFRHVLRGSTAGLGADVANGMNIVGNFLPIANRIWKASVLFRPGYLVRTLSDEVLVAMAVMGSINFAAGFGEDLTRIMGNLPTRAANTRTRYLNKAARARGELPSRERIEPRRRGQERVDVGDGLSVQGFFGGDWADVNRALTSTNQRGLFEAYGNALDLLRRSAYIGVLDPADEVNHLAAWVHALNHQIGGDELARQALQLWHRGLSSRRTGTLMEPELHARMVQEMEDTLVGWLRTPRGEQYAAGNTLNRSNPRRWVRSVIATVDHYTVGSEELIGLALSRNVRPEWLQQSIPMALRPSVHGGEIDRAMGTGKLAAAGNALLEGGYKLLNQLPTDKMVRHPMADYLYNKRVRELVASARAQGVDLAARPHVLYRIENAARQSTIKNLKVIFKDHLFDSPPTALRFMMPFFGAWRASLGRWGRIVGENPAVIQRFNQAWQGLHKPFDVIDEDGNLVESDDEQAFGLDTKNSIVVRLPKAAVRKLGVEFAPAVSVSMKSFNTVLQGDQWYNAGFGPFVQIPLAFILKSGLDNNPYWAKSAGLVLPYGVPTGGTLSTVWQGLAPTVVRNAASSEEGMDSKAYATRWMNILRVEVTNYQMGIRRDFPDAAEVSQKAHHLSTLQTMASFLSPVGVKPVYYDKSWEGQVTQKYKGSPGQRYEAPLTEQSVTQFPKQYQFLAGKLRDMRNKAVKTVEIGGGRVIQIPDPQEGERQFLAAYPEAFAYMQSINENKAGIPANMAAWGKSRRVRDLMKVAPDIFAGVAGITMYDTQIFDPDVYNAQRETDMGLGTGEKMRNLRSSAEAQRAVIADMATYPQQRRYSAALDELRTVLHQRNLFSFEDPGAEDLKEIKARVAKNLGMENPLWWEQYTSPDPGRARRIVEQATGIANDPRFAGDKARPDIAALRSYLQLRESIAAELRRRKLTEGGSADLKADVNQDLLVLWERQRAAITEWTPMFESVWFDRYFENDLLADVADHPYPAAPAQGKKLN